MDITPLLHQALQLMAVGMSVVIMFLVMLVGVLKLVSAVVNRNGGEVSPAFDEPIESAGSSSSADEEIVAVISSAIHRFRAQR